MSFEDKLKDIKEKYEIIGEKLLNPEISGSDFAKLSKEYSDLGAIYTKINEYFMQLRG